MLYGLDLGGSTLKAARLRRPAVASLEAQGLIVKKRDKDGNSVYPNGQVVYITAKYQSDNQ